MNTKGVARLQKWRLTIINHASRVSGNVSETCRYYGITRKTYYAWHRRFVKDGEEGLKDRSRRPKSIKTIKAEDESYIKAVFEVLHSPPSKYGFNRTSWKLSDIRTCLERLGTPLSKRTIGQIVKNAGYSWRKARTVLTSNDPNYTRKLNRIKKILSALGPDERFFSIDEFGPLAVKMIGGRQLVGPCEHPSVPQFQRSKGVLLMTAALELSTNQITHFYSQKKNTAEMIRLLEVLLDSYRTCSRIYLSWDAASWHLSQRLKAEVARVNRQSYLRNHGTPEVTAVPLPASAQFLNVIESVFSGMARAVIHNSNYASLEDAQGAVDRYLSERNGYFRDNPRVAGNLIWGKERTNSVFSESQNCVGTRIR